MKKRVKNILGTLLLVLAIAATQIPVPDVEATTATASDFQMDGSKLVKYTGTAITVSVPDTVTEIGDEAFLNDTDLYAVYLPKNLEKIGKSAFSGCSMLTIVDFPKSLKEIGNFAFYNTVSLKDVELYKDVKKMGHGVFAGCTSLENIKIPKENEYFICKTGALYDKKQTKLYQALAGSIFNKYNMPSSVTEIMPYAFWGCKDLRFVAFSSFLKTIPSGAFSNCKGLEEITLPYSVKSIDTRAFSDCTNLQKVVIPPSVNTIHPNAFEGCPLLKIEAEEGSAAEKFDAARDKSQISATEYEDTAGIASDIQRDETQSGPSNSNASTQTANSTGELGAGTVVGGQAVVFIENRSSGVRGSVAPPKQQEESKPVVSDLGSMVMDNTEQESESETSSEGEGQSEYYTGEKGGQFPKYTIVDNKIAGQAYYKDLDLTSYAIPNGITEIGKFSFSRSGLAQIIIPESVTKIGYGAFYHCDSLEKVVIPTSVTEIAPYAFEKTKWLENWKNGGSTNNYYIVGDGILIAYKGKESKITVPEGVKQIGAEVFKNHKGITEVSLPSTLKHISEDAFAGCNNLTTITGGVNVEKIDDRAFSGCPIDTIRIHDKVKEVGLQAFDSGKNAVVFLGKTLPVLSYEDTAQRLSRKNYREPAFRDAKVAVVDSSVADFKNTILDPDYYGFRGLICYIEKEATGSEAGSLYIVSNTLETEMPESVSIYGKPYGFSNKEEKSSSLQQINTEESKKPVSIQINSSIIGNTNLATAAIPGNNQKLTLSVQDSENAKNEILKAYQILYGEGGTEEIKGFDISLQETNSRVPITRLGSESMKITLPLPDGIGSGRLHVVCTDEDGQLEEVNSRLIEINRVPCVEFEAKHFSAYGMYSYGSGGPTLVDNGNIVTALTRRKDASPDTGDLFHPKWFLATGLFSLAMMVFSIKKNGKKKEVPTV